MRKIKRVLMGVVSATLLGMLILTGLGACIATLVAIPYLASNVLNAPDWVTAVIVFVELSFLFGAALLVQEGVL